MVKIDELLDTKELKQVVATAILQTIDKEKRDVLIKDALQYLLTEQTTEIGYGYNAKKVKETYLRRIFHNQVEMYARDFIRDWIKENDEFKTKINELLSSAWKKFIEDEQKVGSFPDLLAKSIASALSKRDNDY